MNYSKRIKLQKQETQQPLPPPCCLNVYLWVHDDCNGIYLLHMECCKATRLQQWINVYAVLLYMLFVLNTIVPYT